MSKLVKISLAAASVLALSTAFAQAGNNGGISNHQLPTLNTRPVIQFYKAVACEVAGTPSEFPDDIWITNKGAALAKGTIVHWSVPYANKSGNFALPANLATGASVFAAGVLPGGAEAGRPCSAKL